MTSFRLHKHATGAGPNKIHKEWFDQTDANNDHLGHLIPVARDIMQLRDCICLDFKDSKWNGTSVLPIRWTDQPTMTPTNREQLWGSGFGNWLRYRSVKAKAKESEMDINFLPSGVGKKGYNLPATLLSTILGLFRDCIWVKHSSSGQINFIGWYTDPMKLWTDCGQDIMGAFKYKWNSIQDTVAYRKEDELYKMEAMKWGQLTKNEEAPAWFYDIDDSNKKYVIENALPTHHLKLHPTNNTVAKIEHGIPLNGEQGYILG